MNYSVIKKKIGIEAFNVHEIEGELQKRQQYKEALQTLQQARSMGYLPWSINPEWPDCLMGNLGNVVHRASSPEDAKLLLKVADMAYMWVQHCEGKNVG